MARVGSARYDIEAEDRFSRVLERAGRGFSRLQANIVTANAAIQLGAFAADAFAGALNRIYNEGAQVIDRQAKVAAAIATTTEYFEAAQFSAGLNGIAAEQVQKGYLKMTDAIGEAADGTLTYQRAIDRLGLDAEVLKLKSTEEQYKAISEAFGTIGNQAERVQISRTIFGRQGAFFIRNTAEQIQAAREEMDSFGISTSRVDATKVEAANDAIFRLETIAKGAKKEFAAGLAPAVQTVADAILDAGRNSLDFESRAQRAGMAVIGWVGLAVDGYELLAGASAAFGIGLLKTELAAKRALAASGNFLGAAAEALGFDAEKAAFNIQVVEQQLKRLEESSVDIFSRMDQLDARDGFIESYKQKIREAEVLAEEFDRKLREGNRPGSYEVDEEEGKERERVQARIQALTDQLATEEELIDRNLARRLELIDQFESLNTDKRREAEALRFAAEQDAQQKRKDLRDREAEAILADAAEVEQRRAALASEISQISGGVEAERAAIIEQAEARLEIIREYAELEALTKEEYNELYLESERRRADEITALRQREAAASARAESDRQRAVLGYLEKGLAAASSRSRKAFEFQKALDIGRALIAGKVAAVEAFKWGMAAGGPKLAYASAFASAAATGAMIQEIGGRSFSPGGASSAGGTNTEFDTAQVANVANTGDNVTIIVNQVTDNRFIDDEAFGSVVMDTIEEQVNSLGLTGKVDLDRVRLQVNREGRA